jgi:hypothetical protein
MKEYEVIFAVAVIVGMIIHYCKKSLKHETTVSIIAWFTISNVKASLCTVFAAAVAIIGALSNNLITADMTLWSILYIGFTTGYAIDSTSNSD